MNIKLVKIIGLNIPRLLKKMELKQINVKAIRKASYNEIEIEISSRDYKKLIDLNKNECYNIVVIKNKPKFAFLSVMFSRVGILIGVIVMACFVYNISNKIWDISVAFDEPINGVSEESVLKLLNDSGVSVGKKLTLSARELEKELLKNIDASSMVTVKKNGINLEVFIKAREFKPELSSADIVAEFDGVITEINLVSGILTTNIGEAVTKGQVLISSGTTGDYFAEAIGDVYAKARICGEAIGALETTSVKRTGNKKEITFYELMGKQFGFNESIEEAVQEYSYYEIEEEYCYLFDCFILPLKKVTLTIYELTETKENSSNAELITNLKQQAYNDAIKALPQGAKEEKVSYDVFNEGGLYKVVCIIESTINIAKRQ